MKSHRSSKSTQTLPWEPKTFIFRGYYNPYIGGVKPSFFMVLGSKGIHYAVFYIFNFPFVFFASPKNPPQEGFVARSSDIDIVYIYGFFCKKTRGIREDVCLGNLLLRWFFFYGFYYMGFITMFHQHLGELLFMFFFPTTNFFQILGLMLMILGLMLMFNRV